MSFHDRPSDFDTMGRRSGPGGFFSRVFGDGENPLSWALPLYRLWGISVRVHVLFVVYVVLRLAATAFGDSGGFAFLAPTMGMLFLCVLLHEYGHCFACRYTGGSADDILLWPLGGLASCMPPDTWRANLITVIGGPAVNLILAVPAAGVLLLVATPGSVFINPVDPGSALADLQLTSDGTQPYWLLLLWSFYFVNVLLFAFNMLVPMYPMDAGRILHCILWANRDKRTATEIVVTVGYVAAGALLVAGMAFRQPILMGIAMLGAFTCWQERRALRYADEIGGGFAPEPAWATSTDTAANARAQERAEQQAEKQRKKNEEQAKKHGDELDRILAKISSGGMDSLTKAEKKFLANASDDKKPG